MARYALVIGIDTNLAPLKSLSKTKGDAEAIANLFDRHGNFVEVKRLIGSVTQKQLEGALQTLLLKQAERHEVVIYYTGHGFPLVESFGKKRVYLAPSDCKVRLSDGKVVHQDLGIPLESLNELIQGTNLSSLVVLLECCYGGSLLENSLVRATMTAFTKTDYFLIAACREFEQAYALKSQSHSIFTTALLKGLEEKNDRGQVTTGTLFDFIAGQLQNSGQEPFYLGGGRSLTLISYQPAASAPVSINETNPYQGLLAFTAATARFFFGRDRVVQDLVAALSRSSFVPLIGASGSGKSSVVRAGLIPRLQELGWRVLEPIKPGADPISKLKGAFDDVFERRRHPEIYRLIDAEGLQGIVDRLPDQKHLLVIDQFEEVFTLLSNRGRQREFIEKLMGLSDRLSIVTTMRSDFVEAWQGHSDLVEMLQDHTVWMPPLEGEELKSAIVRPAEVQGYKFESELEVLILEDVAGEENCLPLLEFALSELWAKRDRQTHQLSVAAYREMGRLMGALDRYATEWYETLPEQQQGLVRRVMLELVRVGLEAKDTRWRRKQAELLALGDGEIADVVELLVERRLLVREGEEIDLAHERLMDGWKLFAEWRQEDRDTRRLRQRVQDAEQEWREKGRNGEYLMQGGLLSEVRERFESLSLRPDVQAFYQLSQRCDQEKIAFLDAARAESELREQAMRILNLLPIQPHQSAIAAIRATGKSFSKLQKRVLPPVQANLRQVIETVRESHRLQGHSDGVTSVAFSPDGQTIVSGSGDETIRLWDLAGNSIGQPFQGHSRSVNLVAFSPDGQTIVSGSDDKTIRLWNLVGNPIGQPFQGHSDSVNSVAFSPDGQTIVSGSYDKTIRLWNLEGNSIGQPFQGHSEWVMSVAFSPDGQTIVSGSYDDTIRLWDLAGNPIGQPFQGHSKWVTLVAFSPDGQTIVSGSADSTICLWDLEGNPIWQPFKGHSEWVTSVAFSPDGQTIVSSSVDSTICLWDLAGNSIGQPFQGHSRSVLSVAFSPDGQTIVSGSGSGDETIRLWDLAGNSIGQPFQGHSRSVYSVAFSPDGQTIVSADSTICLWDLAGNSIGQPFQGHSRSVNSVAFSPDGQTIVSGSYDNTIRLWDLAGNPMGRPFQGHSDSVNSVAFSPDGQIIVSGSNDNTIRLWDLGGDPMGQPFQGHSDSVNSVAFSPDGQTIVSGSEDKTIRLWDLGGNPMGQPFQGHSGSVLSVAFSPDGQTIVSGSSDHTIRLWLGGTWQDWLRICCNRFRHHPTFTDPHNPAAIEACEVCRKHVWDA